jgi:hypothetical protein
LAAELGMRRRLWQHRRTREALLLDLGALVYALHREGTRAPELLRAKASVLDDVDGEVRELEKALGAEAPKPALHGRPAHQRPAFAIVAAAIVVCAMALGFALSEITDGANGEAQRADATRAPAAAAPEAPAGAQPPAPRVTGGAPARLEARPNALLEWPKELTGHTAVLSTTSDRAAALALARQARRTGLEAGLLRAGDHGLGEGLWIVFSGRFDSQEGAARQAAGLAERFPGAYPQRIRAQRSQ